MAKEKFEKPKNKSREAIEKFGTKEGAKAKTFNENKKGKNPRGPKISHNIEKESALEVEKNLLLSNLDKIIKEIDSKENPTKEDKKRRKEAQRKIFEFIKKEETTPAKPTEPEKPQAEIEEESEVDRMIREGKEKVLRDINTQAEKIKQENAEKDAKETNSELQKLADATEKNPEGVPALVTEMYEQSEFNPANKTGTEASQEPATEPEQPGKATVPDDKPEPEPTEPKPDEKPVIVPPVTTEEKPADDTATEPPPPTKTPDTDKKTGEKKPSFFSKIKNWFGKKEKKIENSLVPPTSEISPEKIEDLEKLLTSIEKERKEKLENGPLPLRIKNGVINGLAKWENFGQGEKGVKGFAKRMGKMTFNLALVGAISLISVDQLVKQGVFTASAMGAGTFASRMGTRMAVGLGLGSAMDVGGRKIPDKVKKWLPIALGVVLATAFSGGVVGVGIAAGASAYAGIEISKRIKGKFTNEKITENKEEAKEKLLQKYKKEDGTIDFNRVSEFEKEYKKLLVKFENQGIWGKGLDEGLKILTASAISTVAIGASAYARDHFGHTQSTPEAAKGDEHKTPEQIKHEAIQKQLEEYKEQHLKHEAEMKAIAEANTKAQIEAREVEHMQNIVVHKGEGIEHSFIRQIENSPSLAKELGYQGDPNDTKALHEFAGREAHVIAIKEGYVDNAGHEVRIAEADKIGYEIKTEDGHIIVEEKTIDGKIIETHHEGDKFGEGISKNEYIKNPENTTLANQQVAPQGVENITGLADQQVPPEGLAPATPTEATFAENDYPAPPIPPVEPLNMSGEAVPLNHSADNQNNETLADKQVPPEGIKNDFRSETIDKFVSSPLEPMSSPDLPAELQAELVREANNIYENNIHQMFPDAKSMNAWDEIKNSTNTPAYAIMSAPAVKPEFQAVFDHFHKLHEITGLNPREATVLEPIPETPQEFEVRATLEAIKLGKSEEIKL